MRSAGRLPLRPIVTAEWRLLFRDGTGVLALALFSSVMTYAVWNGHDRLLADERAYETLRAQEADLERDAAQKATASERVLDGQAIESVERYVRHGPTHPRWVGASWSFRVAALPPPPLGFLAVGKLDVTPVVYKIRTDRWIDDYRQGEQTVHPLQLFSGVLDPTTVVIFFTPLLVIALGADLVSGERERGTWDLLRAQPVPLERLVLTRMVVRAALTATPVVGAAVAALVIKGESGSQETLTRLSLWLGGGMAYLCVWWGTALVVTSKMRSSAGAVSFLVAAWVMTVLVIPSTARLVIEWWAPVPSRAVVVQAQRLAEAHAVAMPARDALAAYLATDERLSSTYGDLVERADRVAFASGPYYLVGEARDFVAEQEVRPALERLNRARREQERLAAWASIGSPALLVHRILLDAVGTGDRGLRHFRHAVDAFHRQWRDFFLPRVFELRVIRSADYAVLPRFVYEPLSPRDVFGRVLPSYVVLLSLAAVLFRTGLVTLRRHVR